MKCCRCNSFVPPGISGCPFCGTTQNFSSVDVHPPRANSWRKILRNIPYFYRLEEYCDFVALQIWQNPQKKYLLLSIIPTAGLIAQRQWFSAVATGFFYLIALVATVLFWGSLNANIALGMLLLIHVNSVFKVLGKHLSIKSQWYYYATSFAIACILFVVLYLPCHYLRRMFIEDVVILENISRAAFHQDDVLLIQKFWFSPKDLKKGDVVSFVTPDIATGTYYIEAFRGLDRILATPGDSIEFTPQGVMVNGRLLERPFYPIANTDIPTSGNYVIPENHYFIYPSFGNIQGPRSQRQKLLLKLSVVHISQITGKVWMIYQPWERRQFL